MVHAWRSWFDRQAIFDPARLVFIDETATSTAMAPAVLRAERGVRCDAGVPRGHGQTTTCVGGLRHGGIVALMMLDGAMSGTLFRACTEQLLALELALGNIVFVDNWAAPKAAGVREAHGCSTYRRIHPILLIRHQNS